MFHHITKYVHNDYVISCSHKIRYNIGQSMSPSYYAFHVPANYVRTWYKVCPKHSWRFMFPQNMSEHDTKYVDDILGVSCSKKNRKVCSAKYVPLQSMLTSLTFYVTAKYVALQTMFHKQHFMSRHKMYMSRHK